MAPVVMGGAPILSSSSSRQRAALSPSAAIGVMGSSGGGEQYQSNNGVRQIDQEVQVLNHCFDDIERFVARLQAAVEAAHEMEKRVKQRRSKKKASAADHASAAAATATASAMTMRAQLPQPHAFVDVFQKFKLSFNLLARLKAHIHDPNAPELVHFLFTPLTLIVSTLRETASLAYVPELKGLARSVWTPLLSRDAKELLLNCLTSREQDLWVIKI